MLVIHDRGDCRVPWREGKAIAEAWPGASLITTHGLDPNDELFGSDILIAGEPHTVPITLTIAGADPHNPTFDGQSTVTLFRSGSTIKNK